MYTDTQLRLTDHTLRIVTKAIRTKMETKIQVQLYGDPTYTIPLTDRQIRTIHTALDKGNKAKKITLSVNQLKVMKLPEIGGLLFERPSSIGIYGGRLVIPEYVTQSNTETATTSTGKIQQSASVVPDVQYATQSNTANPAGSKRIKPSAVPDVQYATQSNTVPDAVVEDTVKNVKAERKASSSKRRKQVSGGSTGWLKQAVVHQMTPVEGGRALTPEEARLHQVLRTH